MAGEGVAGVGRIAMRAVSFFGPGCPNAEPFEAAPMGPGKWGAPVELEVGDAVRFGGKRRTGAAGIGTGRTLPAESCLAAF